MVSYDIEFSKKAAKDAKRLTAAGLDTKAKALIELLRQDPFSTYPAYEKLKGEMRGIYSRRINIQHRLVYEVDEKRKTVHILRMWTHYE